VGAPRVGIHGRDHPTQCDLLRDAPAPLGVVGSLDRFDILAGDQDQQRHRLGALRTRFRAQAGNQQVRITEERVHELGASARVVPRDHRLTRNGVLVGAAVTSIAQGISPTRRIPPIKCVTVSVGRGRVIEDRGARRPPGAPVRNLVSATTSPSHVEDPIRCVSGAAAAAAKRSFVDG